MQTEIRQLLVLITSLVLIGLLNLENLMKQEVEIISQSLSKEDKDKHKKENETSPRSTLNVSNQNRSSLFFRSNVVDGEPVSQQMETKT